MLRKLALTVLLLALSSSCSSGTTAGSTPSPTASKRPSSTAQLAILTPNNGETVKGPKVHIAVSLTGATIVPLTTTNLRPDEGHIHVKLDGQVQSMTAGTSLDLPDVKPGSHVVIVEFVASDHAPFDPRLFTAVTFKVS